jgi:3-(methylthio)propanoyl-CoA dehydrogenase
VHGGMGYIEETGAAQHFRDARIATIYEGTTGIQSNDLVGRKLAREGGATAKAVIALMRATEAELARAQGDDMAAIRASFSAGISAVDECVDWIVKTYGPDIKAVHAGSVPFLTLMGIVAGGWQMARSALVARRKLESGEGDSSFYRATIGTARFYAGHVLSQAGGLRDTVLNGAPGVMVLAEDQF